MYNTYISNETIGIICSTTKFIKEQYGVYIFKVENKKRLNGIYKDYIVKEYEAKEIALKLLELDVFFLLQNKKVAQAKTKILDFCKGNSFSFSSTELLTNQLLEVFGIQKKSKIINKAQRKKMIIIGIITTSVLLVTYSVIKNLNMKKIQNTIYTSNSYKFYVASNSLNLRAGPSTEDKIIAVLSMNEELETSQEVLSGWCKVTSKEKNLTGYVNSKYLSPNKTEKKIIIENVNNKTQDNNKNILEELDLNNNELEMRF